MTTTEQYDSPKEARFRNVVRIMLNDGVKPTPMTIYRQCPGEKFVNLPTETWRGPTLSGTLSRIRREEFFRAGWKQNTEGGRWYKP